MSKSMKGFVVGPSAVAKKSGIIIPEKTKLEKLQKKKLKLEKQINKERKKQEKKNTVVLTEQQAIADTNKPATSLTVAMIQATGVQ